jgi:hypothetical protein
MSKAREFLDRYIERAEDTGPEGLTSDDPLSVEINGKYVDILFCTGGPHFEVQVDMGDAESGEYWFENEPVGGVAHYANWGEADWCGFGSRDANLLILAILRDPDELDHDEDED